ncbi:glycosyltransferase family 2 protein [Liquorilactobacillus nagelii]|uniref:glycosyltransferase family 2 protein n=1 Tax=Liquorilactobacillus nagelii TaxID=82688 RepID=UPI0039E846E0
MVTFIIPTYKRKDFLICAVKSIFKQKFKNIEIIIVDDDPLSNLSDFLKKVTQLYSYSIIYIRNPKNMGPGYCRKRGLEVSKGDYVIFMDDDDFYINKSFLNNAINIFKLDLNLSFVSYSANYFYNDTSISSKPKLFEIEGKVKKNELIKGLGFKYKKPISTFTTIFRKKYLINFLEVYDIKVLNDTIIYLISSLNGDGYFNNEVIGNYRIHDNNITQNISFDFVEENMDEKIKILNYVRSNYFLKSYLMAKHSWISIEYLMENNKKNLIFKILKWTFRQKLFTSAILVYKLIMYSVKKLWRKWV